MSTLSQVRDGAVAVLKTIKLANGYSIDLPDNNFFTNITAANNTSDNDAGYPKVLVEIVEQITEKETSNRFKKTAFFVIAVFLRQGQSQTENLQPKIEGLIEDVEKAFRLDSRLGNLVHDASITHAQTDGGGLGNTEAVSAFTLKTERYTTN